MPGPRINEYIGAEDVHENVRFIRAPQSVVLGGMARGGICVTGHAVAAGQVLASLGNGWVCYEHCPPGLRDKMGKEVRRVDALELKARRNQNLKDIEYMEAEKVFGPALSRQPRPTRGGLA